MAPMVLLTRSGSDAELVPDPIDPSCERWVLQIDGREQSHVDLAHPEEIRYEYLRRIAHLVDAVAAPAEPIRVLHLGAGALTLARYVQATRPGSSQVAVEIERELAALVLGALPLPRGTDLRMVVADAADALEQVDEPFDVTVLDVFTGAETSPAHLAGEPFYARALAQLSDRGILAVDVGDDPPLTFYAQQALALGAAAEEAGLPGPWTLCDAQLLGLDEPGNLVLAAGGGMPAEDPEEVEAAQVAWLRAGPHPAAVLDPEETADLSEALARRP